MTMTGRCFQKERCDVHEDPHKLSSLSFTPLRMVRKGVKEKKARSSFTHLFLHLPVPWPSASVLSFF